MKLTLGPLQYFWPRRRVLAFYDAACAQPLDAIYLGETVCSKRRELRTGEWIELGRSLARGGREVILSTLALIEAESELATVKRLVDNGELRVEANDMAAVQFLRERRLPFVAGPSINVYNHRALALLQRAGMTRLVLGVEQGRDLVAQLRAQCQREGIALPELEIIGWGRLPLSYSARCFTARAYDVPKDDCGFRCIAHPDGLALDTREGQRFLVINGVQVQGATVCDLAPEVDALAAAGIDLVRLYPQAEGTEAAIARWREAIDSHQAPPRLGDNAGYWYGTAGMGAAVG